MATLLARSGDHPDLEVLVADLAAGACTVDGTPIGPQATGTANNSAVSVFVHVERATGAGGLDRYGVTDTALIYVATRAPTRAASRDLTAQLRAALRGLDETHVHRGVLVDRCTESTPPAPQPGADTDQRLVESGWVLTARAHVGDDVAI